MQLRPSRIRSACIVLALGASVSAARGAEVAPVEVRAVGAGSVAGQAPAHLVDGSLETADARPALQGSRWRLTLREPGTVIGVRVHQSARKRGWSLAKKALVHVGQETALPLDFDPGKTPEAEPEGWRWTRVPRIAAREVVLEVTEVTPGKEPCGGFDEVVVQVLPSAPAVPAEAKEWSASLDLHDVGTKPKHPFGASFNVAFFEKGLAEGITEPSTRRELLGLCRELPVTAMRFPGGTWAYAYPLGRDAIPALKEAGLGWLCYFYWWPERFALCDEESFFRFCRDAGMTAWYQLNPGFLYDAQAGRPRAVPGFSPPKKVTLQADPEAPARILEEAKRRAAWCRKNGIDVVWEIGNEDHCWWAPEGYARITAQLIRAIREVDPGARFAVCGDSKSWSDFKWQEGVLAALRAEGIEHFDYSSVHCYFAPGGVGEVDAQGKWRPYPWSTGREILDSARVAWGRLRGWYDTAWRERLHRHGFTRTEFAVTELNMHDGNAKWSEVQEHSMGRALGEAWGYPDFARSFAGVFFHDLVRSGPGSGNWFQRLDYYPSHVPGCRYHVQADLAVMRLMYPHARGALFHNAEGLCASRHPGRIYLTFLNPEPEARRVRVSLANARLRRAGRQEVRHIAAASLDSGCYDYWEQTSGAEVGPDGSVAFTAPPFSAGAVWLDEAR